jgi:HPt (histidine-containing phosphotransfer) domain-containing protein
MSNEEKFEYIDMSFINDMSGGDNEFLVQMLEIYFAAIPKEITALQEAVRNDDSNAVVFSAHKLKGSFNFIGNKQLTKMLEKIEHSCDAVSDWQYIPPLTEEVAAMSAGILAELNGVMERAKKELEE